MKAIAVTEYGGPEVLKISELPIPRPIDNQILVKVSKAALNRADIIQRNGNYPLPEGASNILGLELAGQIVALGENVQDLKKGQRICGLVDSGAYAEYCLMDANMAIPIPGNVSDAAAAAIPEAFLTAQEAVFTLGKLQTGESVLFHAGASGISTAGIQLAKAIGATVYFTAGSKEKISRVLDLGADIGINYKEEDYSEKIMALTNSKGIDVIIDYIGKNNFQKNMSILKEKGRITQVAFMSGKMVEMDLSVLLFNRLQIKGLVMRRQSLEEKREITHRFVTRWLSKLLDNTILPVVDCEFDFSDVQAAHQYMEDNKNIGKIILSIA